MAGSGLECRGVGLDHIVPEELAIISDDWWRDWDEIVHSGSAADDCIGDCDSLLDRSTGNPLESSERCT